MYYTEGEINELMVEGSNPAKCAFTLKPSNDYVCQSIKADKKNMGFLHENAQSGAKFVSDACQFVTNEFSCDFLLQLKVAHCKIRVYTDSLNAKPRPKDFKVTKISII